MIPQRLAHPLRSPSSPLVRYATTRRPAPGCRRTLFIWWWFSSPSRNSRPPPQPDHRQHRTDHSSSQYLVEPWPTIMLTSRTSPLHNAASSSSSSGSTSLTYPSPPSSSSSSSSSSAPPPPPPPRKPTFTARLRASPAAALLGIIPLITLGLGFWQVYRLRWKLALIDELDDKLNREALWLPGRINVTKLPEFQYRRVLAHGHLLSTQTMYVGPRTHEGIHGYHAVTPLAREGGSTILINRGFVAKDLCPGGPGYASSPLALEAAQARANGGLGPEVTIEGLLRMGTKRGWFTPDNKPDQGVWYWLDLPSMALACGGEAANVQPVLVDEIFEGHSGLVGERVAKGVPVGRPARVELRNMHAVYAATWFSLSAATAAMFWALMSTRRVSGKGKKWRP